MSAFTKQAMLFDKYKCTRLNMEQLADALDLSKRTIYTYASAGTLGVKLYEDKGRKFADIADVADYLESCRSRAA